MLKNRLVYLFVLLAAVALYTFYTGWTAWYLLLFLLFLPVLSLLLSICGMRRLRVTASMPTGCIRNASAVLELKNTGSCPFPLPVCRFRFFLTNAMTGEVMTLQIMLAGSGGTRIILPTEHCARMDCQLGRGHVYDYLGLFRFPLQLPALTQLTVQPVAAPPEPIPNLTQFQSRAYRPKNGGGFSEIHDMRPYRPGDSMRDIHWKLSAKTDNLVVREPQEPNRGLVLVTLDLAGTPEALDETLDTLLWVSQWLLAHEVTHDVRWIDPATFDPMSVQLQSVDELQTLVSQLLGSKLQAETPSIADRLYPNADWRYHIRPSGRQATV